MKNPFKTRTEQRRSAQHSTLIMALLIMAAPLLAAPFTDNGDGTVTDQKTNLIWQKCSMGQNNDATCTGTATMATWANALTYCNTLTLAGKSAGGWRLPSINELKSIVDETKFNPSIDATSFPAIVAFHYWSSSTYAGPTTNAWNVSFNDGNVYNFSKAIAIYVRCVSN